MHEEDQVARALDRVLRFDPAQLGRYVPHRSVEGRAAGGNSPGMGSSWLEPVDGEPSQRRCARALRPDICNVL